MSGEWRLYSDVYELIVYVLHVREVILPPLLSYWL